MRCAIIKSGTVALREVAGWCDIGGEERQALAELLAQIDLEAATRRAIEGERAAGLWAFDKVRREGPGVLRELLGPDGGFWRMALSMLWPPSLAADERTYLDIMERQIERAGVPWREWHHPDLDVGAIPRSARLTRMLVPALFSVGKARDGAEAELAGSCILLGLLTYRERHGAYPEALRNLRVELKWHTPPDPFSGADFFYRPVGEGFLLYSIGDDLQDDGGRPVARLERVLGMPPAEAGAPAQPQPKAEAKENRGDIVWRQAR